MRENVLLNCKSKVIEIYLKNFCVFILKSECFSWFHGFIDIRANRSLKIISEVLHYRKSHAKDCRAN